MANQTNEQKFKTAEERVKAFNAFCENHACERCPLEEKINATTDCPIHWLALEAEEEKPEPCPFCGRDVKAPNQIEQTLAVVCQCGYRSEWKAYVADAIAAHNRVARAVRAAREGEVKL